MYKLIAVALSLLLVLTTTQPSAAAPELILTDAQIESIRTSCQTAKVNLAQLHNNDAVQRINLGQRYENIARRLMAPLNSRIGLNGLDSVDMSQTTVYYKQTTVKFKEAYLDYRSSVLEAAAIDCRERPIEFYSALERARVNRLVVAENVDELYRLAIVYKKQFASFRAQLNNDGGVQ